MFLSDALRFSAACFGMNETTGRNACPTSILRTTLTEPFSLPGKSRLTVQQSSEILSDDRVDPAILTSSTVLSLCHFF
jgi:hypothetical protein